MRNAMKIMKKTITKVVDEVWDKRSDKGKKHLLKYEALIKDFAWMCVSEYEDRFVEVKEK